MNSTKEETIPIQVVVVEMEKTLVVVEVDWLGWVSPTQERKKKKKKGRRKKERKGKGKKRKGKRKRKRECVMGGEFMRERGGVSPRGCWSRWEKEGKERKRKKERKIKKKNNNIIIRLKN